MSKIDDYNKQKQITSNVVTNLRHAQGLNYDGSPEANNDKAYFRFADHKIWDSDIPLYFHASYGYYGSSYGYSACNENVWKYLMKALENYAPTIVAKAIEYAQEDEEKALRECKEEAENILKQLGE